VVASFVYAFQIASPEQCAQMWQEMENDKAEATELKRQKAVEALEPPAQLSADFDAETMRYKTVVEKLDLPPDVVAVAGGTQPAGKLALYQYKACPFRVKVHRV
jgi:hypothetical protein